MWNFLLQLINSKSFRLLLRVIASVASAVAVISGFLFWQSQHKEKAEGLPDGAEDENTAEPEDLPKRAKVHFLHRK